MKILRNEAKLIRELEESFNQILMNANITNLSQTARELLLNKIKFEIKKIYFIGLGESIATLSSVLMPVPILGSLPGLMCDARQRRNLQDAQGRYLIQADDGFPTELKLPTSHYTKLTNEIRNILEQFRDHASEARYYQERGAIREQREFICLRDQAGLMSRIDNSFSYILTASNMSHISRTAREFLLQRIKEDLVKLYFPSLGESLSTLASIFIPFGGLGREVMKAKEQSKITDSQGDYLLTITSDSPSELRALTSFQINILNSEITRLLDRFRDHDAEARAAVNSYSSSETMLREPAYIPSYSGRQHPSLSQRLEVIGSHHDIRFERPRKTPCEQFCVIL